MMSDTMRLRVRVKAPRAIVHRALTDAGELRTWLAEHAEVELPHRYAFWGRYTPEGDTPHQRPLLINDDRITFAWLLGGIEATVDIGLETEGADSTILELSHTPFPTWQEALSSDGLQAILHTYWALMIANLIDHVEGRELTARVDLTSPEMRESIVIDAAPEDVFDSLVDAEKFSAWFGAKVGIEPHVGGRFAMGGFEANEAPAKIIELVPGRTVGLEWPDGMVTHWELEGSEGKTRLTIVESGFDETRPPYGGWLGWLGGVAELRRYHELPDWSPVWLSLTVPGLPDDMLTIG
jgi:uncharacterized protein YndB with AHSA1/START domain